MGTQTITSAPGLALSSDPTLHFLGAPVTTNQIITYAFLVLVVVVGTLILRASRVGLKVRAVVDSESMASLSGTHPGRVALGVWAASSVLAGIAGILVAPTNGLTADGMTTLMAAAFAAVVAARLRSLPGAVVVALAMGVVTDVIQKYLPVNSTFTADVIPSVPFAVMFVFLVFYAVRARAETDDSTGGGPLDRAIRPAVNESASEIDLVPKNRVSASLGLVPIAVVAALPLVFRNNPYWLNLVALGMCYGITFLTFTVVTGEGGMLWLSQIIFAGAGAIAAAQFATVWHVPILLAVLMGGFIAAVAGAVIGVLTIRLGDLYVGLGTLTFGLLAETLIFDRNQFTQGGLGVTINRPAFASGDFAFSYLALVVFVVFAILIMNLRRSTSGIALRAVRDSESASRTIGLSVFQVKVIVGALGAFVAAVGGGFLALYSGAALPQSFDTFAGLVWLAVVVTMGVRSVAAAALSGMAFALLPGVVQSYLPGTWGEVPALLFGLGAIAVARNPEGAVLHTGRQLRHLLTRFAPKVFGDGTATGDELRLVHLVGAGRAEGSDSPLSSPGSIGQQAGAAR